MIGRMQGKADAPVVALWKWLPPITIVVVIALASVFTTHFLHVSFHDDFAEHSVAVPADALEHCLDAAKSGGNVSTDAIRACADEHLPAHPSADALRTDIDEVKWLLTLIIGIAAVFTVLQAGAAWFSASSYREQADEKLKKMDEMRESFLARYPMLLDVEKKRAEAHAYLTHALEKASKADDPDASPTEALSWLDDFYRNWDPAKRQLVLSVESFVSIDLYPGRVANEAEDLKRFAIFYHSKFRNEKVLKVASFQDLERAQSYLTLAIEKERKDFTLLNELGQLYLTMREHVGVLPDGYPDYVEKARTAFLDSMKLEKNQQRARYDLAYLMAFYEGKHEEARICLLEATARSVTNWQRNPSPPEFQAYLYYNLGCNCARIVASKHTAAAPITEDEAKEALDALQKTTTLGAIRKDYVEDDYTKPTGDIIDLYQKAEPSLRARLDELKVRLVQTPQKKAENIYKQAFDEFGRQLKSFFRQKP